MSRFIACIGLTSVVLSAAPWALAQGGAAASASVSGVSTDAKGGRPESNYLELGIFGGVLMPAKQHNFQDESRPHQSFKALAPEIGARLAYFPLGYLGAEVEGAVAPTKTEDGGSAGIWAVRAHAVGQLPLDGFTPFVLLGAGRMGAGSNAMGSDSDPSFHFGAGAKLPLDDFVGLRLDVRDNLTKKNDASGATQVHHPEVLLGLAFTIDPRKKAVPPPPDTDGDGFVDPKDECPKEAGVAPDGCPAPDGDADGILDANDACPTEAGPASDDVAKNGCPIPKDGDADGVTDDYDKCPKEVGPAPDGCPDPDPDKDGVLSPNDKCPNEAESVNGFQDDDGCPDELPADVKKFSGVIQGIEFDTGKATIRPKSTATLDEALKVLKDYPDLRLEISGHTDDVGNHDQNVALSQSRADAVKAYFVSRGIEPSRISTRGAGPDQPIADNKTPDGKQKNRRIEFRLSGK